MVKQDLEIATQLVSEAVEDIMTRMARVKEKTN